MSKSFHVDVVSPEATVWSGEATFVVARTPDGEIGIMADHEPVMATLVTSAVLIEGVDANKLTEFLERAYKIHVRPRFVENEFSCIRIAPNVFTTLEEVDLFAGAIERAATRGVS